MREATKRFFAEEDGAEAMEFIAIAAAAAALVGVVRIVSVSLTGKANGASGKIDAELSVMGG